MRVLYLTDDAASANFCVSVFKDALIEVIAIASVKEYKNALKNEFDAILMDGESINKVTGFESANMAVSFLRNLFPYKVMIVMVHHGISSDIVVSILNSGANDVLLKPPRFKVIAEQIKSLARFIRPKVLKSHLRLSLGDDSIVLDIPSRRCYVNTNQSACRQAGNNQQKKTIPMEVQLTRNEFRILMLLLGKKGLLVSYEEFREKLWPDKIMSGDIKHALLQHITDLRKKLGEGESAIENVWGEGFRIRE
jgi:DNA-binding response OmpR family regulator